MRMLKRRALSVLVLTAVIAAPVTGLAYAATAHDDAGATANIDAAIAALQSAKAQIAAPVPTVTVTVTATPAPTTAPPTTAPPTTAPPTTAPPTTAPPTTAPPTTAPPTTAPPTSGFPSASNTGVPAGTTLTASGTLTITSAGVVEGKNVSGTVNINASNVTFRKSRVTGSGFGIIRVKSGVTGVRIEDVTIDGLGASGGTSNSMGVIGPATVLRSNISGVENGVTPESGSLVQDNYIHDLGAPGSPHLDGIQMDGGLSNIQVLHNTIIVSSGSVSAVMADNYFGSISNIKVDGNRLLGGQYTVYSDGSFNSNSITGLSFTNNRMMKGNYGYSLIRGTGASGVTWSGNVNDATGAAV